MSGWLVVEDPSKEFVRVVNLENVSDIEVFETAGGVRVRVYRGEESVAQFELDNWKEAERLINILPGINDLGWVYVLDGFVVHWRGRLELVEELEESNAVGNLTEEEENAVLKGGES